MRSAARRRTAARIGQDKIDRAAQLFARLNGLLP
jgi:hypothetical protein